MIDVKIKTLAHFDIKLGLPKYETLGSAGADIKANLTDGSTLELHPGQKELIPTGLSFEIPFGHEIQVRPRSGLSFKTGLMVVNSPGTIDSDYRGELKIIIANMGDKTELIKHGDRVAQIVLAPVTQARFIETNELTETTRGKGGFGSTGVSLGG
ncbi:MAG: dUTP diphosphatase [Bacteriovoracaceae bacterium]